MEGMDGGERVETGQSQRDRERGRAGAREGGRGRGRDARLGGRMEEGISKLTGVTYRCLFVGVKYCNCCVSASVKNKYQHKLGRVTN